MDPFVEKELIDCLKAISATLNNIDTRIEDLTVAVREVGAEMAGESEGFVVEESDVDDSEDEGEEEKI
jgi:hypothetical protein